MSEELIKILKKGLEESKQNGRTGKILIDNKELEKWIKLLEGKEEKDISSKIEETTHKFVEKNGMAPTTCFLTEESLELLLRKHLSVMNVIDNFFDEYYNSNKQTKRELINFQGLDIKKGEIDCVAIIEQVKNEQ